VTAFADASSSLRWESLPPLWVVVLVIVPAVFLLVRFLYKRESGKVGRKLRMTMGLLRALAILLVLVALFGPYAETIEGEFFKRHLILCVDTSGSMGITDAYQASPALARRLREAAGYSAGRDLSELSRLRIVQDILGRDREYLEKLADRFHLHVYAFDSSPVGIFEPREGEKPTEAVRRVQAELPRLKAQGQVTRIGTAIRDIARAFAAKNEPVAGVLLFTDGRHTGGAPYPIEEARQAKESTRDGIAVFPVGIGDPAAAVNIGVSSVDANEVVLAGDDVSFTATVHARGLKDRSANLEAAILDAEGEVSENLIIAAEPFALPGDEEPPVKVTFRHRFPDPGTYDLRIGVKPRPEEAVKSDNYKRHVLQVARLKMRVLLITSKPNYTYRFLKEALFRSEQTVAANVLLLSAEPEWPQEASRGVDSIRIFPQDRAALAPYDVVIMIDVDPRDPRFGRGVESERIKVLENIEHWVKGGGGLVLQAGRDGYIPDQYVGTPVAHLLPVVPATGLGEDKYQDIVRLADEKRYKLTEEGARHPVMRILQDPEAVRDFWDGNDYATKYYWYAPVQRAKKHSTTVLAVRRDPQGRVWKSGFGTDETAPLIAIQSYGYGKVLWLATDELWRMRDRVENLYYWRFWSGIIRHLATHRLLSGNRRIKIWVDRTDGRYQVGDSVGIEAKYLDENFEPVVPDPNDADSARKILKLRSPEGGEQEIVLRAVTADPPEGIYRARLPAGTPGTYRLIAEPEDDDDPAEATFVVEETTIEKRDPLMDMRTLTAIAKASGGRVLQPAEFHRLLDKDNETISRARITRTGETRRKDLWDRAWVLWIFAGLLAVEWILRRTNLLL
jgi:hypothetical protein